MVALRLCYGTGSIHERQGFGEVGKCKDAMKMVLIHNLPPWDFRGERVKWLALQRRDAATAGNATSLS